MRSIRAASSPSTAITGMSTSGRTTISCNAFQNAVRARAERRRYLRRDPRAAFGHQRRHPDHPVDQRRFPGGPRGDGSGRGGGMRPVPHRVRLHDPQPLPRCRDPGCPLPGRAQHRRRHGRWSFRTLDVGSDKHLPYWRLPPEDNPAMGWRALRMVLDRPIVLRGQLRALIHAAAGRRLQVMFPMVAEVAELDGRAAPARRWSSSVRPARAIELPDRASKSAPWSRCRRSTGSSARCCSAWTSCRSAATTCSSSCSPATGAIPRCSTATTCCRRRP